MGIFADKSNPKREVTLHVGAGESVCTRKGSVYLQLRGVDNLILLNRSSAERLIRTLQRIVAKGKGRGK